MHTQFWKNIEIWGKMTEIRHNWTIQEIKHIYDQPLLLLVQQAHAMHGKYHDPQEIQVCTLISVKTGGCSEDCKYCAQSARYQTTVSAQRMLPYDEVLQAAKKAISQGASRICLGAAWREVRDNMQFEEVLRMVRGITALGAEVCCTLGMLEEQQAAKLKEAGLYAYNHNLDSSEKFYRTIITTRSYAERLKTLEIIEKAGISVCCGGIMGMGETVEDRLELLLTLSKRTPHPDSVPINKLSPIAGTPLEDQPPIPFWEMLRMIATARIVFPKSMVRLSAGRCDFSLEQQALLFLAGANSIHLGEKLLTIGNTSIDKDQQMFELFGLKKRAAFVSSDSSSQFCKKKDL